MKELATKILGLKSDKAIYKWRKLNKDIDARVEAFRAEPLLRYRQDVLHALIDEGKLPRGTGAGQYRRINFHRIALSGSAQTLDKASRLSTDYDFFEMLRTNGRRAARRFLDAHYDDIGVRSTLEFKVTTGAASA